MAPELTPAEIAETRYRAMVDPARRHLLRVIEDSADPCDVETLAAAVGLHPNTVRGHLEVLERANLVSRSSQQRNTPGRPRLLYTRADESSDTTPGGYRLLAEMLTTSLVNATENTAQVAIETGREWGRYLTERLTPGETVSFSSTVDRITQMLASFGFAPHPRAASDGKTLIELSDCPFRDLARDHENVVCALHQGMLEGAAESLGGSAIVEGLEPFVAPSLCRTTLRPA